MNNTTGRGKTWSIKEVLILDAYKQLDRTILAGMIKEKTGQVRTEAQIKLAIDKLYRIGTPMQNKTWSEEDHAYLVANKNRCIIHLCEKLQRNPNAIYTRLNTINGAIEKTIGAQTKIEFTGVIKRESSSPITKEHEEIITRMTKEGAYPKDIAKVTGLTRKKISNVKTQLGLGRASIEKLNAEPAAETQDSMLSVKGVFIPDGNKELHGDYILVPVTPNKWAIVGSDKVGEFFLNNVDIIDVSRKAEEITGVISVPTYQLKTHSTIVIQKA